MQPTYDSDTVFVRGEVESRRDERLDSAGGKSFVESTHSFIGDDLTGTVNKAMIATRRTDHHMTVLKALHLQPLLNHIQRIHTDLSTQSSS